MTRILWLLLIAAALAAGYFQSALEAQERRYKLLEDRYVRLRHMLGVQETQRLLDDSYQYIDSRGTVIQEMNRINYE